MRALPTTHTGWLAGDARRKTTPVPGVRTLCVRARRSRAVFRLPVGAARHAKAAVPPRTHFRYGTGDSRAEALRLRRGGGRDAVSPFADPWTGRRRLWPKANRRRRWGRRGEAPRALLWFLSWASKKGTRCRSTTDKLRRSMSGKSKDRRRPTTDILLRSPSGKINRSLWHRGGGRRDQPPRWNSGARG